MTAALDTNLLLDILIPSDGRGLQSKERLVTAYEANAITVSDIVYAELVLSFRDRAGPDSALQELAIALSPSDALVSVDSGAHTELAQRDLERTA